MDLRTIYDLVSYAEWRSTADITRSSSLVLSYPTLSLLGFLVVSSFVLTQRSTFVHLYRNHAFGIRLGFFDCPHGSLVCCDYGNRAVWRNHRPHVRGLTLRQLLLSVRDSRNLTLLTKRTNKHPGTVGVVLRAPIVRRLRAANPSLALAPTSRTARSLPMALAADLLVMSALDLALETAALSMGGAVLAPLTAALVASLTLVSVPTLALPLLSRRCKLPLVLHPTPPNRRLALQSRLL
jgi:hypothetical protein